MNEEIVEILRNGTQADADGVMVIISRQAVEEAANALEEQEEDSALIQKLSTILAGIAIAFNGDERPLHRHSYHDLVDMARAKCLEIDLLNMKIKELRKIAAHVPARIYIKATEDAGFGTIVKAI